MFVFNDRQVGLPAFDHEQQVVGFYRDNAGETEFFDVNAVKDKIGLTRDDLAALSESLERYTDEVAQRALPRCGLLRSALSPSSLLWIRRARSQ
jgi:hypothetical protein